MMIRRFTLFFLLCTVSVYGQTRTSIRDTLYNADGSRTAGQIEITWNGFRSPDGKTIAAGKITRRITDGVLDLALVPNAGATPAGTSYAVTYLLASGLSYSETWVVPQSDTPVSLAAVCASAAPAPSVQVGQQQLSEGGGLQVLLDFYRAASATATRAGQCYWNTAANALYCSTGAGAWQNYAPGTPALHAGTHASNGADPVTINASQITSGTLADSLLPASVAGDKMLNGSLTLGSGHLKFAGTLPGPAWPFPPDVDLDTIFPFGAIKVNGNAVAYASDIIWPDGDLPGGLVFPPVPYEGYSGTVMVIGQEAQIVAFKRHTTPQAANAQFWLLGMGAWSDEGNPSVNLCAAASDWSDPFCFYTFARHNGGDYEGYQVVLDPNRAGGTAVGGNFKAFGTINAPVINAVRYAEQFPGLNAGAKIAAAIADLPSVGGTVDARSLIGYQEVSANIFNGVTKPVTLLLGAATFNASVDTVITSLVHITGSGDATVWYVTGATNGFTFNAGSDHSRLKNLKITGNFTTSVHGVSVTAAATPLADVRLEDLSILNFKAGAGVYFGLNSVAVSAFRVWTQGNRYGYYLNHTNNAILDHAWAVNNANAADVGTQFRCLSSTGILMNAPVSEVTNPAPTVEGFNIGGCQSVMVTEYFMEHTNTGNAIIVQGDGTYPSSDVRFLGGTWQGAAPFTVALAGDNRTIIENPSIGLADRLYNLSDTDYAPQITLSPNTQEAELTGTSLWKAYIVNNGAVNVKLTETPESRPNGGLFEGPHTNLIPYSEDFTSGWTKSANIAVTGDAAVAPDGTTTAEKIEKTAHTHDEWVRYDNIVVSGTSPYTFSVWLKADTAHWADLYLVEPGVGVVAGKVISVSTIWRRFFVVGVGPSGLLATYIRPVENVDTSLGYVYAWGAQFEQGGISSYIPTFGTTVSRQAGLAASKGIRLLDGHLTASGQAPTLSACGTGPTLATGSSDVAGKINTVADTGVTCLLTFVKPFVRAPACFTNDESAAAIVSVTNTTSTTTMTLRGTVLASKVISYGCIEY